MSEGPRSEDEPGHPWLLVSDVDDTLTGDGAALEALWSVVSSHRDGLRLALNSSRPAASVDATLAEVFPSGFAPDAVITAMGTQIRVGGAWVDEWTNRFMGWPYEDIFRLLASLGHRPHAAEFQTPAKVSFAVPAGAEQQAVREALERQGLPCRIIASGTDDLDILPPNAGKDHATVFLARHLNIPVQQLVVAGDSANDLAMFQVAPHAIAVGNARDELVQQMPQATSYHANASHAAGVLEGLRHFNALPG